MNENWSEQDVIEGENVIWNKAKNQAFWDWYYVQDGYTKETELDYDTNCHGHTFKPNQPDPNNPEAGRGDWITSAQPLVNKGGPGDPCFIPCTKDLAVIASDADQEGDDHHSMRVEGMLCQHESYPINVPKYKKSSEQFRESGIYTQQGVCPHGINVNEAHHPTKWEWAYGEGNSPVLVLKPFRVWTPPSP